MQPKNCTFISRSHWASKPWPCSTGKPCRVNAHSSVVVPISHRSPLLPRWTLICYCSRAAVRHAADSRWQPGRMEWRMGELEGWGEGGQEHVAYVGGSRRGGWRGDVCVCVCVCACVKKTTHSLRCQHQNIMLAREKRRTRERLDALQNHCVDCSCY